MADALEFTNSDQVLKELSDAVGRLCIDATGYKVVEADSTIPKPDGPYILVDLTIMNPMDWSTNEIVDDEGITHVAHNYVIGFTLTAYRGKPHWALSKVHQSFGLPFLRERYFPTGSLYAYSSTSSISRLRVPLNNQVYENRARLLVNFNVCFVEKDIGAFEDVDRIIIDLNVDSPSGVPLTGLQSEIDKNVKPGGDDPGLPPAPNPPITYHDNIVTVCMETPVIDRPELISDKTREYPSNISTTVLVNNRSEAEDL